MTDTIAGALAIAGTLFIVLAGVGVLRFRDLYARMHAATKATALGIALVASCSAVALDGGRSKVILATIFILITAPASAHFIGRVAYRAEGIDINIEGSDDLRHLIDDPSPPAQ